MLVYLLGLALLALVAYKLGHRDGYRAGNRRAALLERLALYKAVAHQAERLGNADGAEFAAIMAAAATRALRRKK